MGPTTTRMRAATGRHDELLRLIGAGNQIMTLGVIVPQGWTGEYAGWDGVRARQRTDEGAQLADRSGFDSIWLFDHFHTTPEPTDEPVFELFTTLSALAAVTENVGLGQIVACAAYRNPALLAKMVSTLDVISGGRV